MNGLTDKTKTDQAVMAVEEITRCAAAIDVAYLHLGKMLWFVKQNQLYKHYAEHTQTMSAFLREIDIGIGMSQCDHLIRVFKTFGEHLEGRKIAFKRLLLIHSLVAGPETIDPLLDLAEKLPMVGLISTIKERKGLTPPDGCQHPAEAIRTHYRCSVCGTWLKGEKG